MKKLTIKKRLNILIMIIITFFIGIFSLSIFNMHKMMVNSKSIYNVRLIGIQNLVEADRDAYQSNYAITQLFLIEILSTEEKKVLLGEVLSNFKQIDDRYNIFLSTFKTSNSKQYIDIENEFSNGYNKLDTLTKEIVNLITTNNIIDAKSIYYEKYLPVFKEIRGILDMFTNYSSEDAKNEYIDIQNAQKGAIIALIIIFCILLTTVIIIANLITSSITRALEKGIKLTNEISNGNFSAKIDKIPQNEIGKLLESLMNMATSLNNMILELDKHKEHLEYLVQERTDELLASNEELNAINEELHNTNEQLLAQKLKIEETLDQLKETQAQLIQSKKMASLGILSAGIAHEINNPINFVHAGINNLLRDFQDIELVVKKIGDIKSDSDNIKEKIIEIEKLKEEICFDDAFEAIPATIKYIKVGADRTAEIVKGLRVFSRDYKGELQNFNIHEGIDASLTLLTNKYKNRIDIIKDYAKDLPEIKCYPGKLNQVFLNILSNAIDSICDKGTILISTKFKNSKVVIAIKDNGCGMSNESLEKLYDPFYTTKPVGKGIGLGLSITYGIILEHNGAIEVNSELNKGTEFIITLPFKFTK